MVKGSKRKTVYDSDEEQVNAAGPSRYAPNLLSSLDSDSESDVARTTKRVRLFKRPSVIDEDIPTASTVPQKRPRHDEPDPGINFNKETNVRKKRAKLIGERQKVVIVISDTEEDDETSNPNGASATSSGGVFRPNNDSRRRTRSKKASNADGDEYELLPDEQGLGFPMPIPRHLNKSGRQLKALERRRVERSNPNSDYRKRLAAKRTKVAKAFDEKVYEVQLEKYEALSILADDVQSVLSEELPTMEMIKRITERCASSQNTEVISPSSGTFAKISSNPDVVKILLAIARNPFGFRLQDFIGKGLELDPALDQYLDGLLEDDKDNGKDALVSKSYLRVGRMDDPIACFQRYLEKYPAEAFWAILHLRIRGADMKLVEEKFIGAMALHNHSEFARRFIRSIVDMPLPFPTFERLDTLVYAGTTARPRVSDRQKQDEMKEILRRYNNFNEVNAGSITWETAGIPSLNVDLDDPRQVRSDPIIAELEEVLTDMASGMGANMAPGGFFRRSVAAFEVDQLSSKVKMEYDEILSQESFSLFGSEVDPQLISDLRKNAKDEVDFLNGHHADKDPCDLESTHFSVARALRVDTIRLKNGIVPCILLANVPPAEQMRGYTEGSGDEFAGRSYQEYRRVCRWLDPNLPESGSLTTEQLALHIGPSYDLWTWMLKPTLCWRHTLWLSRHLIRVLTILIVTWSAVVDHILCTNGASDVWARIPFKIFDEIMGAHTPADISRYLDDDEFEHHESLSYKDFMKNVGSLVIVYVGPKYTHPRLLLRSFHGGVVKYDPALADIFSQLQHVLRLMQIVVLLEHERLSKGGDVDWESTESLLEYFKDLKTASLDAFKRLSIQAELDRLKLCFNKVSSVLAHLRSLPRLKEYEETGDNSVSNEGSDDDELEYKAPVDVQDLPMNDAEAFYRMKPRGMKQLAANCYLYTTVSTPIHRDAQLAALIERFLNLEKAGQPGDPQMIVPYKMHIARKDFRDHFRPLEPGTNLMYSANALGKSDAARQAIADEQARKSESARLRWIIPNGQTYSPAMLDEKATYPLRLLEVLRLVLVPKRHNQTVSTGNLSTGHTFRWAVCGNCGAILVGDNMKSAHACPQWTESKTRNIVEAHFNQLERICYPHDILNNGDLLELLGSDLDSILSSEELESISVSSVVASNFDFFTSRLLTTHPKRYSSISENIYFPSSLSKDIELQTTTAMDIILDHVSDCPSKLLPIGSSEINDSWGDSWTMVRKAFGNTPAMTKKPKSGYYFARCSGTKSECATFNGLKSKDKVFKQHRSKCTGDWDIHEIKSFTDLPPSFMKRIWFSERLPIHAKASSKFLAEYLEPKVKAEEDAKHLATLAKLSKNGSKSNTK